MFLFRVLGADTNFLVLTGFLMVAVSFLPDLDFVVGVIIPQIKHRGITHTFLFGTVVGALFSAVLGCSYGSVGGLAGFVVGFGGTASHLIGDVLTCELPRVKPFYPFSDKELSLGFFKASDKKATGAILVLGAIAFTISYLILCVS
jgi:membrane-bound metal-dependent hydrolase YbcI (DUF457 family)